MIFIKGDNFNSCIQQALDMGLVGVPAYCFKCDTGWRMGWLK